MGVPDMINKIYFKLFPFLVIFLLLSKNVYAQGSAADQYKQISQLFYSQHEMGQMMFRLLYSYFDAKSVAMKKRIFTNKRKNC